MGQVCWSREEAQLVWRLGWVRLLSLELVGQRWVVCEAGASGEGLQVGGSQAVKQTETEQGEERGEQRLEAGRCWWEEGNGAGRGVFRKTGSVNPAANRAGGVTVSQVKS